MEKGSVLILILLVRYLTRGSVVLSDNIDDWIKRWQTIAYLKGKLYHVPGIVLSAEVSHLAASERLMVFSTTLQKREFDSLDHEKSERKPSAK
jgi:hypothetical protein